MIALDQTKIGKFIAQKRKNQSLTQKQLAETMNISDKTVSKWECGRGMPEVAMFLPLCEVLQINVNELLSGENLTEEKYHEKAEENIMDLVKEREESKKKIILSVIIAMTCAVASTALILVAGLLEMPTVIKIILILVATIVMTVGMMVAIVLDKDAGTFECKKCHNRFVPSMSAYVKGVHSITSRYLKCPECGESGFCKRKLTR